MENDYIRGLEAVIAELTTERDEARAKVERLREALIEHHDPGGHFRVEGWPIICSVCHDALEVK